MFNRFLNILFPESCTVCEKPATDRRTAPICFACWQTIAPYRGNICRKCGKPVVSGTPLTCGECLKDEPLFKSARSFGLYDGVLKKAINQFKYNRIKRIAQPLSDKILQTKLPAVDIIIPVSLHEKRLRQKEFNQSALLAKHIAKNLGIPMILDCLVKTRDTMPQVGLSAKARKRNIKKAYEIKNRERVYGKSVMLIDDVYTTGATVRECSKVLKKAGATDIHVITLARSRED